MPTLDNFTQTNNERIMMLAHHLCKVFSAPAKPLPKAAQAFFIPFIGFYDAFHEDAADNIVHHDLECAVDNHGIELTDELLNKVWENHNTQTDWQGYRQNVAVEYAKWLMATVLDCTYAKLPTMRVSLYSPKEYNFATDAIMVELADPLPELKEEYFFQNNLLGVLGKEIRKTYDNRVEKFPSTEEIFNEPIFLGATFRVYACHKLGLDPLDWAADNTIDRMFMIFAVEHYVYNDAYNTHHKSDNLKLLGFDD